MLKHKKYPRLRQKEETNRPRQESRSGFFIWHHKWNGKNIACFTGFFRAIERMIDVGWHGRFHVKMKVIGKCLDKILNWFVGLNLGQVNPIKLCLFLECNRTEGCSWTVKWNLRSRLKKMLCTFTKLSGLKYQLKFKLNYLYILNIIYRFSQG